MKLASLAVMVVAGLSVAACTNTRKDRPGLAIVQSLAKPKSIPVVSDPNQVANDVSQTLAVVPGPLALATFEKTNNNVVLRPIATNGSYKTWASAGSADRRSVTTRHGLLTATRGLNQDLMSSDVSQTLSLLKARQSGSATRVQRYLNGEDQIFEIRVTCAVSKGGQTQVQIGEINRTATEMTERCDSPERSFTNIYRVDGSGRVLQSVQWLNDFYGTTVIQQLR
ncbi:MAG: YjbF family lipoprotein [Roseovarius sp.]